MRSHSFNLDGIRVVAGLKRKRVEGEDILEQLQRQDTAQRTTFVRSDWQLRFLQWAINDEISLRQSASALLRGLIAYRNPIIEPVLPQSHTTTRIWIVKAFHKAKEAIRSDLSTSISRISISFDGWKSDNELDLLGVMAHYVEKDYKVKNVLIAIRNTFC